jgi:hypothetical protein
MIKKIRNYQEFILENQNSLLPPLVEDFLENIKGLEPEICFEDWWCISTENIFLSYFENPNLDDVSVANNEEREERNKSGVYNSSLKKISPYFVIEFVIKEQNKLFKYFVIGIDLKKRKFYFNKVYPIDYQKKFIDFSDETLKKYYPITYNSRRYGL